MSKKQNIFKKDKTVQKAVKATKDLERQHKDAQKNIREKAQEFYDVYEGDFKKALELGDDLSIKSLHCLHKIENNKKINTIPRLINYLGKLRKTHTDAVDSLPLLESKLTLAKIECALAKVNFVLKEMDNEGNQQNLPQAQLQKKN